MKSLLDLRHDLENDELTLDQIRTQIQNHNIQLNDLYRLLEQKEREHATKALYLCHIKEIYRLAKHQFSRLQNRPTQELSDADVLELDKWISRAKTEESLNTIKKALAELDKYAASEIKCNLYALVQKIIIEGPYGQKKSK